MRLISFDVGIKNLAYCVLSLTGESSDSQHIDNIEASSNNWSIVEWKCANLLTFDSPETVTRLCGHLVKDKNKRNNPHPCNKTAKWIGTKTDCDETYYCEIHAKMNADWIIPTAKHKSSHINKLKLPDLRTEWQMICGNTEPDKSLKKTELVERIETYYKSKCYKSVSDAISKTKTAGEIDLVTIGRAIRRQLDGDEAVCGITHVIIENQISTIASRMKTIQGMIAQYFIMRFGNESTIEFVSSHNKLKGFSLPPAMTDEKMEKSTYKANKSDGVAICRRFFAANVEMNKWTDFFEKSRKRDDLADCFLQGIWYLKHNKIIYYAEDLKINSVFVS